jgi:hypothetical protein
VKVFKKGKGDDWKSSKIPFQKQNMKGFKSTNVNLNAKTWKFWGLLNIKQLSIH